MVIEILIWIFALGISIYGYFAITSLYKEYVKRNQEGEKKLGFKLIGRILLPNNPIMAKLILAGILLLIAFLITYIRSIFST